MLHRPQRRTRRLSTGECALFCRSGYPSFTTSGSYVPHEGVDTFGQPADTPPLEPDQPAPVVLVPSTKPEPVNTGTPTLTATPTTPDTVGPDTRVDGRYLYTILRTGRQTTEDEWRERHARRRDEEQRKRDHAQRVLKADREHRDRIHADGTVPASRPRRRPPRRAWSYPSRPSPSPPTRPISKPLPSLLF